MAQPDPDSNVSNINEFLKDFIARQDLNQILTGGEINFEGMSNEEKTEAIIMALHCCLNGPVGVNHSTQFPMIVQAKSIKSVVSCTNNTWQNFCTRVKMILIIGNNVPETCFMIQRENELWPNAYRLESKDRNIFLTNQIKMENKIGKEIDPNYQLKGDAVQV